VYKDAPECKNYIFAVLGRLVRKFALFTPGFVQKIAPLYFRIPDYCSEECGNYVFPYKPAAHCENAIFALRS
jgi:hypothetical protein